jgi:hypothetical protein
MTHKYGAKKTEVDGIWFDSKAEAGRYKELKLLQAAGEIVRFELQPKFVVIPAYRHPVTKKKIAATHYSADFRVYYPDGRVEVEDVKGYKTPVYALKKKLVESIFGIAVTEVSR